MNFAILQFADGYSRIANDAAMRAMDAKTRADMVITQIDDIRGRIKGDLERSKNIKIAVDEANDHMRVAEEHREFFLVEFHECIFCWPP